MTDTDDTPIDWEHARRFLSRSLARKLFREDRATLEDLTQEALVSLHRTAERSPIVNVDGLMTTIADRTVIDYLRGLRAWQKGPTIDPYDNPDDPETATLPDAWKAPSPDVIQFAILELFEEINSGCVELAQYYFAKWDWKEVALALGRKHDEVRQSWHRCKQQFVKIARETAGTSWEWI